MSLIVLYVTHLLNGLLMIALGIGAGLWITRKYCFSWRIYWIGAGTFLLSQVGHIPFNIALTGLFQHGTLPSPPEAWRLPFNAIVLGLSAGLFEESARYFSYRWWAKDARTWARGLLLGAGHGGAEAVILGVLVLLAYIVMIALRGADLNLVVPLEQLALAQQQLDAYWSLPWYTSLLGALERAFALTAHLAMSAMVLQVFIRRQIRWLWLSIGWHTLLDAVAVHALVSWGAIIAEALVGGFALASIAIIIALRQPEPVAAWASTPQLGPLPDLVKRLPQVEESPDNLEKTRYDG